MAQNNEVISVIGLGYVGLPVAVEFAKKYRTIGFDINKSRIDELLKGRDSTGEVTTDALSSTDMKFTSSVEDLADATFHIVAVPTPVDNGNRPDLTPLFRASESVGKVLKRGDIVVYESTVYPGATEEDCVPILEKFSGLKCGTDFKVGYSPERINPGDKEHSFTQITKVVSGQDDESLDRVAQIYGSVVTAGVHRSSSIKVAEAAKVIENTQRDLNIALMNELSIIFNKMNIDTQEVLEAAGTKWNFLPFKPGLVGGHCISVDPYYLTRKAEMLGYKPDVILAGRRINDGMGKFIAHETVKQMIHLGVNVRGATITILGLTFKEDCPDLRNTQVLEIKNELEEYGCRIQVCDPLVDPQEAKDEYDINLVDYSELEKADAVVVAVAHQQFRELKAKDLGLLMNGCRLLVDVKSIYDRNELNTEKISFWRL